MASTIHYFKSEMTISRRRLFTRVILASLFTTVVLWLMMVDAKKQAPIQHSEPVAREAHDIWFLETSGRRKLTARQACSIESASRHNGDFTVHLLHTARHLHSCAYRRILSKLPNFSSARLRPRTELAGTPLSRLYSNRRALRESSSLVEHLSDFLRYAIIWKRGGVYLDLDIIVLKSLKPIENSVAFEEDEVHVTNSVLFFRKMHPAVRALMKACARQYDPRSFQSCGPLLLTQLRHAPFYARLVNFLSSSTFFKVSFGEWKMFFDPTMTEKVLEEVNGSYGVHLWNKFSKGTKAIIGSGSPLEHLARIHCPSVYRQASTAGYL
ncbi:hypothetical protein MRX96_047836 [Rhipicephalus microplus]